MTTALTPQRKIEANIHARDITGQIAIGENIVQIGSIHGGIVNINNQPQKASLTRISGPVSPSLKPFPGLLDRITEVNTAVSALKARKPVEFNSQDGFGKTSLLRRLAYMDIPYRDGVVYLKVRNTPVPDLLQMLCDTFYVSEIERKLREGELRRYLQGIHALVLLDDVELGREDVETLMDAAPNCNFVLTSLHRNLWSGGKTLSLSGLPPDDALELIEQELGRVLKAKDRAVAKVLCETLNGHPLQLQQATALVQDEEKTLDDIVRRVRSLPPASTITTTVLDSLSPEERLPLLPLATMQETPVHLMHITAILKINNVGSILDNLSRRGIVQAEKSYYRLTGTLGETLRQQGLTSGWHETILSYFANWAEQHLNDLERIQADMEALLYITEWAVTNGRWAEVLKLVRALDGPLALSKRWQIWNQVLKWGAQAAKSTQSQREEARNWHQMGTLALLLGDKISAQRALNQALKMRQSLGDVNGAAVTNHNLTILFGSPQSPPKPPSEPPKDLYYPVHPEPKPPFLAILLIASLTVIALLLGGWIIWDILREPPQIAPPPIVEIAATETPTSEPILIPPTPTSTSTPTNTLTPLPTPTETPLPPPNTSTPTIPPTPTPTPTRIPPTPTFTPRPRGSIETALYYDNNWNGKFDKGTDDRVILTQASVQIGKGECANSPSSFETKQTIIGGVVFVNLEAGSYCVEAIESTIDMDYLQDYYCDQGVKISNTSNNNPQDIVVLKDKRTEGEKYWFGFACQPRVD